MSTSSSIKVGVIGHDLIGALRGINRFLDYGRNPTLILDDDIPENVDVVASTTMSKITTSRLAYLRTKKEISRYKDRYLFFYENKNLLGNISSDIKAIIDEQKPEKLIICFSWPELKTTVKGAQLFINNIPSTESTLGLDSIAPIVDSYIPNIVTKNTGIVSKIIGIREVEAGASNIIKMIKNCDNRIIICDAVTDYHLDNIAKAVMHNIESWTACGTGGFIRAMTPLLGYKKKKQLLTYPSNRKPILAVLGSLSDVIAMQLTMAARQSLIYPILIEPIDFWYKKDREEKISNLTIEVAQQIVQGKNVAISFVNSKFIPQFKKISAYLLAQISKHVIEEQGIDTLYISGSDTIYAFCRTMGINKLEVKGSPTGDINSIIIDATNSNGKIYNLGVKSGSSGGALELVRLIKFLRQT